MLVLAPVSAALMPRTDATACALCGRDFLPLTFHHLVPSALHKRRWVTERWTKEELQQGIDVCQDCHGAIHRFVPDHDELARIGHTRALLLEHPDIRRYVRWVGRQRGRKPVRRPKP